jgi:hypothetical protein
MPGLGLGSGSVLELGLGCALGSVLLLLVCAWLAEALPCAAPVSGAAAAWCACCLLAELRLTASARSTGMPAGCCARAPVRATGRVSALVEAVGLAVAEDGHGFVLAWRVPCTPVSNTLTAP